MEKEEVSLSVQGKIKKIIKIKFSIRVFLLMGICASLVLAYYARYYKTTYDYVKEAAKRKDQVTLLKYLKHKDPFIRYSAFLNLIPNTEKAMGTHLLPYKSLTDSEFDFLISVLVQGFQDNHEPILERAFDIMDGISRMDGVSRDSFSRLSAEHKKNLARVLISGLKSNNNAFRLDAFKYLDAMNCSEQIPTATLLEYLDDKNFYLRGKAIRFLGSRKDSSLVPYFIEALQDEVLTIRIESIVALSNLAPKYKKALPLIAYYLRKIFRENDLWIDEKKEVFAYDMAGVLVVLLIAVEDNVKEVREKAQESLSKVLFRLEKLDSIYPYYEGFGVDPRKVKTIPYLLQTLMKKAPEFKEKLVELLAKQKTKK